jgi:hypothetical protein
MSSIPLDLQRRFEQRWAARFAPPLAPKQHWPEKHVQQIIASIKGKRKTRQVELAGWAPVPAG